MNSIVESDNSELFKQLDSYDWDNDQEFQGGLRAILGSASSPEQINHLTLRAKCYYFARKFGTKVDFEGYQYWIQSQNQTNGFSSHATQSVEMDTTIIEPSDQQTSSTSPHGDAPTPATFAEICELIAEGKPIPGLKEIPDVVLEGQGTSSNATRRKKPWEKDAEPVAPPNWAT